MQEKCITLINKYAYFRGITFCIQIHKTNTNQYKGGAVVENLPANARDSRDMGSISGLGRFTGVEKGNPLQWFCLGNPRTEEPSRLQSIGLQRARHDQVHTCKIITGDFNTQLTSVHRFCKQISNTTEKLNDTIEQLSLLDIYIGYYIKKQTNQNTHSFQVHMEQSLGLTTYKDTRWISTNLRIQKLVQLSFQITMAWN